MRVSQFLLIITFFATITACAQTNRRNMPGNNLIEYKQDKKNKIYFVDPIDDTINYQKVIDNIYTGNQNKVYILTVAFRPLTNDTLLYTEYFKDITDFLNLKTYRKIKDGYFTNKGKVYLWWANSDGDYPVEVIGADPETFIPFDSIAGGTDKNNVFYGGPPNDFYKINGANPKTIKVLNPMRGCWNCGDCYFIDDKNVYYGLQKIEDADPKTFKLINLDTIDARDKNRKYFEGKPIK